MNWVPLLFIDAVCHQLTVDSVKRVKDLSGFWSEFGAEHGKKRREFTFECVLDEEEAGYRIVQLDWRYVVLFEDLDLKYDRIISILFRPDEPWIHRGSRSTRKAAFENIPLASFECTVLPTIASLVTNCVWPNVNPASSAQNRILFNAFKNCPGFKEITVTEQGEETRDFVARQVEFGKVQRLELYLNPRAITWPEPEKLAETLKEFVSSERFYALCAPNSLPNVFELFALFFKRGVAGELKRGAFIVIKHGTFDVRQLDALYPECRGHSEKVAVKKQWRIPDSNLRISFYQAGCMMRVE